MFFNCIFTFVLPLDIQLPRGGGFRAPYYQKNESQLQLEQYSSRVSLFIAYFKGFNKYVTFQPLYANTIEDISQYDVCKFISNLQFF
jgi:hypothetical protein